MDKDIYDPAFVTALFDRCTPQSRRFLALASCGLIRLLRKRCAARLMGQASVARIVDGVTRPHVPGAKQVVDLMAGTGEMWPHLLAWDTTLRITAIDMSERMRLEAVAGQMSKTAGQIRYIHANVLETDLPDACADMVVCSFGLKTLNASQQQRLAKQIARILKPGGSFALIEASEPKARFVSALYRLYLHRMIPFLARHFVKGPHSLDMIGLYIHCFGDCRMVTRALQNAGLRASFRRHFFGCATSVAGHKPLHKPIAPHATSA